MATSGSNNFIQNRNEIIFHALRLIGAYGIGRTVSAEDMSFCETALNMMIKSWSVMGLHLWAKEEGILFLNQYTASYSLGDSSNDAKVALASDVVMTQLNGSLASSDTAVTVDSTSGMTIDDNIGIVLSDKSIYWATIADIPTSTTITLNSGISGAASDNSIVYTFTNRIYKPLSVLSSRIVNGIDLGSTSTRQETMMTGIAYQTYFNMPAKTTNGKPTQFNYNPDISNGTMYIWPRPSDASYRIEFTYNRILEDLDTATDDFDFPSEWTETLAYQLASRIAPAFGRGPALQSVGPIASDLLRNLKIADAELSSVFLTPNYRNQA